jgi:hypothetical protein
MKIGKLSETIHELETLVLQPTNRLLEAEESVNPGLFEARDRKRYSGREYYFLFILASYSCRTFTFLRDNGLPISSLQAVWLHFRDAVISTVYQLTNLDEIASLC